MTQAGVCGKMFSITLKRSFIMQPRIKMGLIIGVVGLALNVCVSGAFGFCGPLVSLIAGGVAGFLSAQQEKLATKSEGAKAGAISGGIAGGLIIIGQVIGGIAALAIMQSSGTQLPFGTIPDTSDPAGMVAFYGGGVGTGLCFGIIGALLAAGAGAGTGYMATSDTLQQPPASTPM
jgi:hypothetical protein